MSPATSLVAHGLAVLLVVVAPWLGRRRYERAKAALTTDPATKTRVYQRVVRSQALTTAAVLVFWWLSGAPASALGLGAPRSWWLTAAAVLLVTGALVRSAVTLRVRATEVRARLAARAEVMIPDSPTDRRWFAAMSLGSGLAEELAYRGFLFYYVGSFVPSLNGVEIGLVTSVCFGLAHAYQGWRGVLTTTIAGLIMAALYLASGNLLLPMIAHAVGNGRALLIFSPTRAPESTAPSPA
jgi:membrane protease YdiL (CAAX protease family)